MMFITMILIMVGQELTSNAIANSSTRIICDLCKCKSEDSSIDCSWRGLTEIPLGIPLNVKGLDLSHNKISHLGSQAFQKLTGIVWLNLSYNKIRRIDDNTFDGLEALKTLNLNGNYIPYNETGFPNNAFSGILNLTKLFLLTDGCPTAFPESICSIASLEELAINIPSNSSLRPDYTALTRLSTIHLTTQCATITKISGEDLQALRTLPIRRISFRNAQLQEISPEAFYPFKQSLRKLDISCNRLKNAEELIIGLRDFPIDTLLMDSSIGIFMSLKINYTFLDALRTMNLSRFTMAWNNILDIDLRQGVLATYIPRLQYLRMGYNQLAIQVNSILEILVSVFKFLLHVRVLDINGILRFYDNRDTVLNCNESDLLFSDQVLDWENDTLHHPTKQYPEWYYMLVVIINYLKGVVTLPPNLTRLYARNMGKKFESLFCEDFEFEISKDNILQIFDAGYTGVPRVVCIFRNFPQLQWINAEKMEMESWAPLLFANLSAPRLKSVNLRGNFLGPFIGTVPYPPLKGSANVTELDLSSNGIFILPPDFLSYSRSLIKLNLSFNKLASWNTSISSCHHLETLNLSDNFITEIQITYLTELDTHVRYKSNLTLDLRNNEFQCFECSNIDLFTWYMTTEVNVEGLRCLDGQSTSPVDASILRAAKWQCWGRTLLLAIVSALTGLSVLAAVGQAHKWMLRYLYHCVRRRFFSFKYLLPMEGIGVYLSYHERDSAAAEVIEKHLTQKMGISGIVNRESFVLGSFELDEIALHIQSCTVVILLISREHLCDPRTEFEIYMSLGKGFRHILPILISEDLPTEEMPKALRRLLNMNNYLPWPVGVSAATETEHARNKDLQNFFVVFELYIVNIFRRLGLRSETSKQGPYRSAASALPGNSVATTSELTSAGSIETE